MRLDMLECGLILQLIYGTVTTNDGGRFLLDLRYAEARNCGRFLFDRTPEVAGGDQRS
jgi:hypothetical protein